MIDDNELDDTELPLYIRSVVLQNMIRNVQALYGVNDGTPEYKAMQTWAIRLDYTRLFAQELYYSVYIEYERAAKAYVDAVMGEIYTNV